MQPLHLFGQFTVETVSDIDLKQKMDLCPYANAIRRLFTSSTVDKVSLPSRSSLNPVWKSPFKYVKS
jgi:signal-transduction protein with cAMP-binding, CBS, and nucleotidyltransferase domain